MTRAGRLSIVGVLSIAWAVGAAPGVLAGQPPPTPTSPAPSTAAPAIPGPPSSTPFEPTIGQAGKDVVWVPTPPALVEKMLDMAKVTPKDFVMDLGSGDGRNIIAAAKRGARAVGVEFNPDMIALSERLAAEQGVAHRATFIEGDMYEADIAKATVLALFLLPDNLRKLAPKFVALPPGTRIVANTFSIPDWEADEKETVTDDCSAWCTALLWIVPANVEGVWRLPNGELSLTQRFQMLTGALTVDGRKIPIEEGRMRGDEITFVAAGTRYTGRATALKLEGHMRATPDGAEKAWKATRTHAPVPKPPPAPAPR
jgi:SAM-dependent methyltransferase